MSGRELVILLLGLAIIAVVLRGLYVAINVRRGQIKLAIDKNIPHDVDLDALEMAELPSGGARVVSRSLEEVNRQNSAIDLAEAKSKSLNLADVEEDEHIPVLMDAVELSESTAEDFEQFEQEQGQEEAEEFTEEEFEEELEEEVAEEDFIEEELEEDFIPQMNQQEHSLGEENWEDDEAESTVENSHPQQQVEETESVDSTDAMSSIAPDYEDDAEETYESDAEYPDAEAYDDDESSEESEPAEQEIEDEEDEQSAPFDADSSADGFSMTAGERIGGNPPLMAENNQSGLFDDVDEKDAEETVQSRTARSLFSLFGRKSKQKSLDDALNDKEKDKEQDNPTVIQTEAEEPAVEDYDDVLFEENPAQLDVEDSEQLESMGDRSGYDEVAVEENINALDQSHPDKVENEAEASEDQTEGPEHSEVLVLNVTAKEGRVFAGDDLLQVLITEGLKFGDMNIFHKRLSKEQQGSVIFSVANMLNPGTFDLNNMDEFTTLGISFFLALPTPINNLDAFEQMLAVAQTIRDTLDGEIKDDHRNGMTGQTIEHYRQRIRDFELRRLKAVASRG